MGIINSITRLFAGAGPRQPAIACVSAVLALLLGFIWVEPARAGGLIVSFGYYYIAVVFLCFVLCLGLVFREEWPSLRSRLAGGWRVLVILLLLCLFIGFGDRVGYKVLFDEHCLQTTAMHMYKEHQVATISAGVVTNGDFLVTEVFLDKRPYFFAFLVSVLHGIFGVREANAFLLNLLLIPVMVFATYSAASRLTQRNGGLLAACLLATLPILSQCATGAGMDFHNLVMLAVSFWAALVYLDKPEPLRLSLLCLTAVLLTQSRYESAAYVIPVALVILLGWLRQGRAVWCPALLMTPLLLVPYAWHNKYLSAIPELWQLRPGQSSRFSLDYLWGNFTGALNFFFSLGTSLPNSPQLSVLGLCSVLVLGLLWLRRQRSTPRIPLDSARVALLFFGAAVGLNFLVLQFYYWARLDDYLACRFSLPLYWWLCLCVPLAVFRLSARWPWLQKLVWLFVLAATVFHTMPTRARAEYTETNLAAKEVAWETAQVAALPPAQVLVISNKSMIPWVVAGVSSMMIQSDSAFWQKLRHNPLLAAFPQVLITQTLKAEAEGKPFVVVKQDTLPPEVQLEFLAELRQGNRLARISRVVAIRELPVLDSPSLASPAETPPLN